MKIRSFIIASIILVLVLLFFTIPAFHDWAAGVFDLFKDPGAMRKYIASYGPFAPMVSALLMIVQSVIAPLPAFLITFANGLLFGVWWGTALSWSSAMLGAALCFGIARYLGRPAVVKLVSEPALASSDFFFARYGKYAVLIARLIPIISFDVISYGAGLTGMRFIGFWIATGVGQLPATILYSYLGDQMTGAIKVLFWGFGIIVAIAIVAMLIKRRLKVVPLLLLVLSLFVSACRQEQADHFAASVDALSVEQPIYIDSSTKTVWLLGEVQARAFNTSERGDAQYHAIVWKGGRASENALFVAHATDIQIHQALVEIGAKPGNNLTIDAWDKRLDTYQPDADLHVEGSPIQISVRWNGSSKPYRLSEILDDPGGEGFEFRFGGNLEHVNRWKSGCVTCLYSCPGGKVSNASYTIRDFVNGSTHFRAHEDLLPPDGTSVILTLSAGAGSQ